MQVEIRIFGFTGKWLILAWENLYKLPCSRFPTGKQHYDMLRTQERNSVAVLYQVNSLHICSFPLWYLTILCFLLTEVSSLSDVVTSFIWTDLFLFQGPQSGIAPSVERSTLPCEGKLCKAGKSGLAKSSSSFQVLTQQISCSKIIFQIDYLVG